MKPGLAHIYPSVGWVGGGPGRAGNPRSAYEQPGLRATLDPIAAAPPRRTMVLRPPGSANIRLTRVAHSNPDRHHPADPQTRHTQRHMREIHTPPFTNASPYQARSPAYPRRGPQSAVAASPREAVARCREPRRCRNSGHENPSGRNCLPGRVLPGAEFPPPPRTPDANRRSIATASPR